MYVIQGLLNEGMRILKFVAGIPGKLVMPFHILKNVIQHLLTLLRLNVQVHVVNPLNKWVAETKPKV